jgi:predicted RNase H-like HicB family nuclease
MKHLQHTIKAVITEGEQSGFIGSCFGLPVVTQGATLDEAVKNLKEAIELHFVGEDPAELGYTANPSVFITYELEPVHNEASTPFRTGSNEISGTLRLKNMG